jgi:acetyl esterase/lipase
LTRRIVIAGALALALGGLLLFAVAQRSNPEIAIERNLVYGKGGDTDLLLDLAMPKSGAGPFPAVMFLHGRGWREGSRQDMGQFIEGMAGMGYVSVTVEYRLVPAARFPAQVEDCKAAVRWLRANAAKYRIDPDHIGVVGFSAGGHLASMLGVTGPGDGLDGSGGNADQSSRVQAVVSFFGPTDFSTRDWPADLEREVIVPFLGGTIAERPDAYRKASPYNYVTKDAPPFLFFHGSEDELVPVDQSKRLADKLKSAGVPVQLVILDGERHGFSDANNQKAMRQMLDFLGERLRK